MLAASVENEVRRQDSIAQRVQHAVKETMDVCPWAAVFVAVVSDVVPSCDVLVLPYMTMTPSLAAQIDTNFSPAKIFFFQRQEDESKSAVKGGAKK